MSDNSKNDEKGKDEEKKSSILEQIIPAIIIAIIVGTVSPWWVPYVVKLLIKTPDCTETSDSTKTPDCTKTPTSTPTTIVTPPPPPPSPLIVSIESVISDGENWVTRIREKKVTEIPGSNLYSYYIRIGDEVSRIDSLCDTKFSIRLFELSELYREPNLFDYPKETRLQITLQYHEGYLSELLEFLKTIKSEILIKERDKKCSTNSSPKTKSNLEEDSIN